MQTHIHGPRGIETHNFSDKVTENRSRVKLRGLFEFISSSSQKGIY
jgi:hypothetical protein